MSEFTGEKLYELLPAIYRRRDAAQGEPLRALLAVAEAEAQRLEADIGGLLENWFIETCEPWVVPYIADLLGIRRLPSVGGPGFNQRTHVANTLSYRRRKGTYELLADLARDVTGWPVRVVEMFRQVAMTQHLAVLQPANLRTPDLRSALAITSLETPFDPAARTADVRRIPDQPVVRPNLPNVSIFVWRLAAYRVENTPARLVDKALGQYTFSALGDSPLFNPLRAPGTGSQEVDLPVPLRNAALDAVLESLRQAKARALPPPPMPFFAAPLPAFTIAVDGTAIPPEQIVIADLTTRWTAPAPTKLYGAQALPIRVAVDAQSGRLAFADPKPADPNRVRVSYCYGWSGEIGSGPYDIVERAPLEPPTDAAVSGGGGALQAAFTALSAQAPRLIEIADSETYSATELAIPAARSLSVRVRNKQRPVVQLAGALTLRLADQGALVLDGLTVVGGPLAIVLPRSGRARLTLRRCTLLPRTGVPSITVSGDGALELTVERCVTGGLALNPGTDSLVARDSIIDGSLSVQTATLERCTILGPATLDALELASDTIFLQKITTRLAQRGCVRHCYVADGSTTPPRFRCQPDLALSAAELGADDEAARQRVRAQVTPVFTALAIDAPGYAQLRRDCDEQIRRGGSDGGELGAWQLLHTLQREDNLRAATDEYLRFGYEAGIFYVT